MSSTLILFNASLVSLNKASVRPRFSYPSAVAMTTRGAAGGISQARVGPRDPGRMDFHGAFDTAPRCFMNRSWSATSHPSSPWPGDSMALAAILADPSSYSHSPE